MKNSILFLITFLFSNLFYSQTTLSAGDIAIIQYNSDNTGGAPEIIKFITFSSFESGTVINFTDHGWKSDNTFRDTEGVVAWTATRDFICGEIVTMEMPTTSGSGFTLSTIDSGFALTTSGDQIIAFQGDVSSPNFIFAINNEGAAVWQSNATNSSNSAVPTGLTNGTNAVALTEVDNAKYNGDLSGSKSVVLSNICDETNWVGDDSTNQTFTGSFTTTFTGGAWDGSGSDFLNTTINDDFDTSSDGNFKTCNCTVNASQTLTVNSGGTVTVDNNITNNGTILVESGGSVVQVSPNGSNSGTDYTVERNSTSQSSYHVFTFWSSPISSASFAAVAPSTHLYYSFNAASQSWVAGNSSTAMNPGIGYSLEGPDTGTYPGVQTSSFTGAPFNNGDISVALSFSGDGDADNDWNLLGNPYPSAISADTFLADNSTNIGGSIYFWTHNTIEDGTADNTEDDYAMYNSGGGTAATSGGSAPDGNIASGQGFFAQALAGGTVSNLFTNKMRIAGSNNTFFKSSKKKVKKDSNKRDRVWLNLTVDNSFSQILVGFFDDASNGVDRKYDGNRFIGKTTLNFYSLIDDQYFGIQGLSTLKRKTTIPLGFSTSKTGAFKIAIPKKEGKLEKAKIILFDKLLDVKHRLDKADYEFSSSTAGVYDERFELIIKPKKVKNNGNSKKIRIKKKGNRLYVESLIEDVKLKRISVYSLKGHKFYDKKINDYEAVIKLKKIKKRRIYVLKVRLSSGKIIFKKMIF